MKLQQTQSQQSSELESNINISIQHQDDTLRYIRNGLTLIDNVNIEYTDVAEINDYLTTHLYQQQIINDVQSFADELQQRSLTQNYILDPYPIAIPHLKHRLILRPYILVTILISQWKLLMIKMTNTLFSIYLLCLHQRMTLALKLLAASLVPLQII